MPHSSRFETSEASTRLHRTTASISISIMLFLLVFRCGKHKVGPDDHNNNKLPTSSLFPSSPPQRSIYMVMMRMEAEQIQQQIKECMNNLMKLQQGQVYAFDTPLYSLGDAMAFVELSYTNALDAIQQRDNEMAGQWLDMAKLAQEYIKRLTTYLEQEPSAENDKCDSTVSTVLAEPVEHLAEPGLEEWSHAAVLDFHIHDSASSSSMASNKKKAPWYMDPIVTKTFSQKHVQEDREDLYEMVIVDLAKTGKDGRDAVDESAAFDESIPLPWASTSPSVTSEPCYVFQHSSDSANDQPVALVWNSMSFVESGGCPGGLAPRKVSQAWPAGH